MERVSHLTFGPFRLNTAKKRLWREDQELPLRATAVEVLQMLVEHAPHVLTKGQVMEHVWEGTYVTDVALRVCIREIRQALGDDVKIPQYLETVGRKGYRYIGPTVEGKTTSTQGEIGEEFEHIVGRTDELGQLDEWFGMVRRGTRQIVFVTGEPGIGKTTLVEMFLAWVRKDRRVRIGRGQCLEQYGGSESYLPILEALGRLCRDPGGAPIVALLSRYAPTWMIQMPALLNSAEISSLQKRVQGANQQRMLREMTDALEALTQESPFILVLEDLHWSDYSTLELLSYLVQRQERLRFMVIGTYRPADLTTGHPLKKLKRELQVRHQCEELSLALLNKGEVATYVGKHIPENVLSTELTDLIYRRTEGNALFMVNMVNMVRGQLIERDGHWELPVNVEDLHVPESLRQVIEEKIDRLSADDRQILEAASVEGSEFSAMAIAAATGRDPLEIEEHCAELLRQSQFIQETDTREWPDGTITVRYEFIHVLYHEVFYSRLTPGRRAQFHLRIGERLEHGYVNRTEEIAAELSLHFERGRDFHRAVLYLQQVAEQATRRFAYQESIGHLTKARELLKTLPDNLERKQVELRIQVSLGVAFMMTKGYAAPEVKQAYDRARELCEQIGQAPQLAPVLRGLAAFYYVRAELATAREIGEKLLLSVQACNDKSLLLEAHFSLGGTLSSQGEFTSALHHLNLGQSLYNPQKHYAHSLVYGQDPGVACLSRASYVLWFLGYPDQALAKSEEALTLAEKCAHPYSSAYALVLRAALHQLRGEPQLTQLRAEETITVSLEHNFPLWKSMGEILRGWAIATQGNARDGIASIQSGIASWRTLGAEILLSYFLSLLAELYEGSEDPEAGMKVLSEALALAARTGDCWWNAELHRLTGELLLQQKDKNHGEKSTRLKGKARQRQCDSRVNESQSEDCLQRSLDIARRQEAKSLELRAAISLARLRQYQRKEQEARRLVENSYHWFREGFTTADLQQAKALIEELGGEVLPKKYAPHKGID